MPAPAGPGQNRRCRTPLVYASAWHYFNVWALANGRQSLPAEPQTVALYLGRLAADGRAMATIEQARAAISHAHAAEGTAKGDNPARHPVVAETVKGWRNQAPAPDQASALTAEALARIRFSVTKTTAMKRSLEGSETPNGASTRRRRLLATTRAAPGRGSHLSKKPRISWSPSDLGSYSVPRALLSTLGLGPPWIRPQPFDWQEDGGQYAKRCSSDTRRTGRYARGS